MLGPFEEELLIATITTCYGVSGTFLKGAQQVNQWILNLKSTSTLKTRQKHDFLCGTNPLKIFFRSISQLGPHLPAHTSCS